MRDPRVPLIRARFQLSPTADETAYDERVASAVAEFQREKGLPPSGVLTRPDDRGARPADRRRGSRAI